MFREEVEDVEEFVGEGLSCRGFCGKVLGEKGVGDGFDQKMYRRCGKKGRAMVGFLVVFEMMQM